ncbi:MAG: amidohydrolase family protein [Chloroflexales bacterium]|nr:amidohydrolase family protein [Chloroflexales bacterium]
MLDFPLVDAHVHLWNPQSLRIPWLDDSPLLNQNYDMSDFQSHTTEIEVEAIVYVQVDVVPDQALIEVFLVREQALRDPRIQAIVAWAPLEEGPQIRSYLDRLVEIDPRIKGVRRILQGEADPAFCLQPHFVQGVQLLAEYDLSFDICIYHHQLAAVIELVRQCPKVRFMLDHIGKPAIKDQVFDPWRAQIEELAAFPNVQCKLSGLVTEADHQHWKSADLAPYVDHVLAAFGEDRVLFGSDWPVVLLASDYQRWAATLDELTAHLLPAARQKLWADNARCFYRLPGARDLKL